MGRHEESIPPNPNLYPEELQLKLYQAFIFSIPILFSIILFLLFYLFYLKRRANHLSSQSPSIHQSANSNSSLSFLSSPWNLGIKGDLKDKLHVVLFDEELRTRDSLCCVCLGEFEIKEELRQLPLCKHVFHWDCIRDWLRTNATCPLCRCPVISAVKPGHPLRLGLGLHPAHQGNDNSAQEQEPENVRSSSSSNNNNNNNNTMQNSSSLRSEEHVIQMVEQSSSSINNTS